MILKKEDEDIQQGFVFIFAQTIMIDFQSLSMGGGRFSIFVPTGIPQSTILYLALSIQMQNKPKPFECEAHLFS